MDTVIASLLPHPVVSRGTARNQKIYSVCNIFMNQNKPSLTQDLK